MKRILVVLMFFLISIVPGGGANNCVLSSRFAYISTSYQHYGLAIGKCNNIEIIADALAYTEPSWSHDGKRVGYTANDTAGIPQVYVYDTDSKVTKQLTTYAERFGLFKVVEVKPNQWVWTEVQNSPYTYGNKTNENGQIVAWQVQPVENFWLSPLGDRLIIIQDFGKGREIFIENLLAKSVEKITDGANAVSPVWSEDGNLIAFTSEVPDLKVNYNPNPGFVDLKTHEMKIDVSIQGVPTDISPDNSKMLVISFLSKHILECSIPDFVCKDLTSTDEVQQWATYSRGDGRQISYMAYPEGNASVYIMNADGSGRQELDYGYWPVWEPNQAS